ncbi:hypothetical protein GQ53DRAFT_750109 [Thozetella sp. PMI_491]|nr:hypothetical protein GQ53DRAFT_750109 [Thozetella sp. PMI_491]
MGGEDSEQPSTQHNATADSSGSPSTPIVFFPGGPPPMRQATRPPSSPSSAGTANMSGPSRDTRPVNQASVIQQPATATETYIRQTKGVATSTLTHILFSALNDSAAKLPASTTPAVARPVLSTALHGGHQSLSSGSSVAPPVTTLRLLPPSLLLPHTLPALPTSVAQVLSVRKTVAMGPKQTQRAPSAIQKANQGGSPARSAVRKPSKGKVVATDSKGKKGKGIAKAKRSKDENVDGPETDVSSHSGQSDDDMVQSAVATPTVTKSGRQVTRPSPYKPASVHSSAKKRHRPDRGGKPELCTLCGRWPNFNNNKIIICNDCGGAWHQRCYTPRIPDEATSEDANWVCGMCKNGQPPKKSKGQTKQGTQVAYEADGGDADSDAGSQRSPSPEGRNWSKRGVLGPARPQNANEELPEQTWPAWPAPGQGMYAELPPEHEDKEHLEDFADKTVRHIVYNEKGEVIWRSTDGEPVPQPHGGLKEKKAVVKKRKSQTDA